MFSYEMKPLNQMDMSGFDACLDYDGELQFIFTTDERTRYITFDELTEITRLFQIAEFDTLVDAHNACIKAYQAYSKAFTGVVEAKSADNYSAFLDAVEALEQNVAERVQASFKRDEAHTKWATECVKVARELELNFDFICQVGESMLHIDYFQLFY